MVAFIFVFTAALIIGQRAGSDAEKALLTIVILVALLSATAIQQHEKEKLNRLRRRLDRLENNEREGEEQDGD